MGMKRRTTVLLVSCLLSGLLAAAVSAEPRESEADAGAAAGSAGRLDRVLSTRSAAGDHPGLFLATRDPSNSLDLDRTLGLSALPEPDALSSGPALPTEKRTDGETSDAHLVEIGDALLPNVSLSGAPALR